MSRVSGGKRSGEDLVRGHRLDDEFDSLMAIG